MLTVKSSAIALLALVGASVGTYTLYSGNAVEVAEEFARELVQEVEGEIDTGAGHDQRRLFLDPQCIDFGDCCSYPAGRRGLRADFAAAMEQQGQRRLFSTCSGYVDSTGGVNVVGGVDADCEIGMQNNDNPVSVVQGMFGISTWTRLEKDDSPAAVISGTFTRTTQASCTDLMIVFKGGTGNAETSNFVGYKVDPADTSFVYQTPFRNANNQNLKAISHISIYCSSSGTTPPPPTTTAAPPTTTIPPPPVCDTPGLVCIDPTTVCANKGPGWYLCGDSCCNGVTEITVQAECTSDAGSSWCDKVCDDGSGFGDPHFRTWHHMHEFEYHGECDLVFLKAPALDLDIHVRTTIRYDYSFISQVALRIGEEVFEVASWGEYQLDGMASVDLPAFIGGYPITRTELSHRNNLKVEFIVHLDAERDIRFTSYKDYVSVRIDNGTFDYYNGASGILGDYETGAMHLRDGTPEEDPMIYAPNWQVRPEVDGVLFAEQRAPVYPTKCQLPDATAISARARKLGEAAVTREQAEAACAHLSAGDIKDCVTDVIKSQDLDMANSY